MYHRNHRKKLPTKISSRSTLCLCSEATQFGVFNLGQELGIGEKKLATSGIKIKIVKKYS